MCRTVLLGTIIGACISLIYAPSAGASGNCVTECQGPSWAVDPAVSGPVLPPSGWSLFDFIAADGIPFPFAALVQKIERQLGCREGACITPVLVPLGRSLQRAAAAPDFFAYPRAIVAVTGEGKGPLFAKDRLYLAYQEKTNVIEVISYNEAAARFEFQAVRDYREGGTPRLVYANRNICMACHQNHAPIFSRQLWDETNANRRVAEKLSQVRDSFYGIPVHRGVDLPNLIDDATDRANLIGVIHRVWLEACDSTCRSLAITAAIQYSLSGGRFSEVSTLEQAFSRQFAGRWPDGLAIPNPDLPDRDPLALVLAEDAEEDGEGVAKSHVAAEFDPLAPRPPLEVWTAGDPLLARRFVTGLAALIPEKDLYDLDTRLAGGAGAKRRVYAAPCVLSGGRYDCRGEFILHGRKNFIEAFALGNEQPLHFLFKGGMATSDGLKARTANGNLIENIEVKQHRDGAKAFVTITEDFAPLRRRISRFAWPDAPLTRALLRSALDLDAMGKERKSPLPLPMQADIETGLPVPEPGTAFKKACGSCHLTAERFPPNFLAGDRNQVSRSLAQCAPRIFVRLSMWEITPALRDKVPMPPPLASRKGNPWMQTTPHPSIALLRAKVAEWLHAETGRTPDVTEMIDAGYENLRPCLPPATAVESFEAPQQEGAGINQ